MCLLALGGNRNRKKREASCQASFPAVCVAARSCEVRPRPPVFFPRPRVTACSPAQQRQRPSRPASRARPLPAADGWGPPVIPLLQPSPTRTPPRRRQSHLGPASLAGPTRQGAPQRPIKPPPHPWGPLTETLTASAPVAAIAPNPSRSSCWTRASAAVRSLWSGCVASPRGKERLGAVCSRPCASCRPDGLAGPPPPRPPAVRRVEPSLPPLEATAVIGIRLPSSWCRPRRDWSTPARFRRRAGEPPPCAAAFALSPAASPPLATCRRPWPPDP
jgi:hypothetical protein